MSWLSKWFLPKPYHQGFLPEKDGHEVFFAEFGNPKGKTVLVFHGGPGGGMSYRAAKLFDRKKYRIVMFDQRGCGKSLPLGCLEHNTTQDLIDDATRLLNYLKIDGKIIVRGGSWGATLALLWAIQNPDKVERLLLSQIFLADEDAQIWENDGAGWFYPEFLDEMKQTAQGVDLASYYNELMQSDDIKKQLIAANTYGFWEVVRSSLQPHWNGSGELSACELASQRVYINYAANGFWLAKDYILNNVNVISGIPTLIVHNRLDFVCPLKGAYRLHKALSGSELVVVPGKGHFGGILAKTIKKEIRRLLK